MLSRHLRNHLIFAPSTNVGKSIVATGLCKASVEVGEKTWYLKPIGTGTGDGDDEAHIKRFAPNVKTSCLFHFNEPVSPHLAAERARKGPHLDRPTVQDQENNQTQSSATSSTPITPTDNQVSQAIKWFFDQSAYESRGRRSALYIESAGGVHSPTLSGTSQLDAYRPLRPPVILVASHELGGLSTTISAYESLVMRGYDIDGVVIFREEYYRNYDYLQKWFEQRGINVHVIKQPPPRANHSQEEDMRNMQVYYKAISTGSLTSAVERLQVLHQERLAKLDTAAERTYDKVWWPFVQHGMVQAKDIMVIDSAKGDFFSVYGPDDYLTSKGKAKAEGDDSLPPSHLQQEGQQQQEYSHSVLHPVFDGSASWWTQCLGHANPVLTLAAAGAAGRYGHILFPNATSEPALTLTERLLDTVGQNWASRVFFSDDGSTGMEVALKMALRGYAKGHGLSRDEGAALAVLGLAGSYHGDTIGAMDACEGNVYNKRVEWYQGRGLWLDPPLIKIENGKVVIRGTSSHPVESRESIWGSAREVYDVDHRLTNDPLASIYRSQIERIIAERYRQTPSIRFGALILEPIVMGAGGMLFVDPLFQRVLIEVVRTNRTLFPSPSPSPDQGETASFPSWQGLPVIFDEVFVGLRRLGPPSTSTLLSASAKCLPDIACYAKILTGGLVPMAVTLATDSIFQSFYGDKKIDALLHGHSYTAHPVGCAVANKALETIDVLDKQDQWGTAKQDWSSSSRDEGLGSVKSSTNLRSPPVWSLWSHSFVNEISTMENVEGAMAMGTVLSIYLRTSDGSGYQSTAAEVLLRRLREGSRDTLLQPKIHARPLGNVVYFMCSLNSEPSSLREIEHEIKAGLIVSSS